MRVTYSIGVRFAGGGIGTTSYHAVQGLYRNSALRRLLCGSYRPSDIPSKYIHCIGWLSRVLRKIAVYDKSQHINYVYNTLYDRWAERHVASCDVFHGWGNFSLKSLRRANQLGAVTVVERASSHPRYQYHLLREEYGRWGRGFRLPAAALQRAEAEIRQADYVLIPSDFVRNSFCAEGIPDSKLLQLPFGVDVERFRPVPAERNGPFRALFVGQVGIRKGVPYLLDTWRQLGWDDAELWLLGRTSSVVNEMLDRDSPPGIRQLGYVDDPVSVYQQVDVFVFPTIEEGSALVTYEAMACGLPVITTPNAGSLVRDGEDGFIVPIRDTDTLAARLEKLRAEPMLRRTMGQSARRHIEPFTWKCYGDRLVHLYDQHIDTR